MHVPFVDLKAQYLSIKNEIDASIFKVINDTQFIGTAGLATRLFGEFSLAWKISLVVTMAGLMSLAIAIYPNQKNGEE